MMIIGLTGPTGAGKSMVCALLRDWEQIGIIDCDQVARYVVQRGQRCLVDLALEFTPLIIDADGNLNRRRLAELVFTQPDKRQRMNEIMFPYILEEIKERTDRAREGGMRAVFLDAPTLFESGADALCEKVVVVLAHEEQRLLRIIARDRLTVEEAANRMRSQHDDGYYEKRADYVLRNDSDRAALRLAVLELQNHLGL